MTFRGRERHPRVQQSSPLARQRPDDDPFRLPDQALGVEVGVVRRIGIDRRNEEHRQPSMECCSGWPTCSSEACPDVTSILRGFAFSLTGMTSESTPLS